MVMDPQCTFCQIVAGEEPAEIVLQDEHVTGFMDINPVTPGHTLVIPNRHSTGLRSLPEEDASILLVAAQRLAKALLQSELRCEAVNLFMADGTSAGQTVFHTHLHVIPRFRGDGSGIRLHSHGGVRKSQPLSEHAAAIRSALEKLHD